MANTIKIKQSAVASKVPTTAQLALGELAINTWDGKLFLKKDNGTASIVEVGAGASGGIPTGITGILMSDGSGAVSAATPGTDYPGLATANIFSAAQTMPRMTLNDANGTFRSIDFSTGGSLRWKMGVENTSESTGNVGSHFFLNRYGDGGAGAFLSSVIQINRTTGLITLGSVNLTEFLGGSQTFRSTDATTAVSPSVLVYRDRASPAASDNLGGVYFQGNSSVGTLRNFAAIYALATTVTDGAEDGELIYRGISAGTVAERARIGPDGVIRTKTNASANTGVVVSKHWTSLTADYTLTSATTQQKLFNNPTNGRLTLPTGVYEFDCLLYVTTMSATTGNMQFDLKGAGGATLDRIIYHSVGSDSSTPTTGSAAGSSVSVASASGAVIVTTGTGTGLAVSIRGMFRVTAAGTIIPSCLLTTAAAAVVKAGSYFKCAKIGETTESFVGAWA